MRIGLAQFNPLVGDLAGNCQKILEFSQTAAAQGAELVVFPELSICGYPPKDLLLRRGFTEACDAALQKLAQNLPQHLGVLVGHPTRKNQPDGCQGNAASLLTGGEIVATVYKTLLPNYDVFDEQRYFCGAATVAPVLFQGRKLGIHICEDAWFGQPETRYHNMPVSQFDPVSKLIEQGADLLINLSASPFEINKISRRYQLLAQHCQRADIPAVFVNQVGGNDDLVFDGSSLAINSSGEVLAQLPAFEDALVVIEENQEQTHSLRIPERSEQILGALVCGVKDYAAKCGFREVVLGLSGGIDSAVVCAIAAEAFGGEKVHAIMMPSRHSSDHSIDDSVLLAQNLGLDAITVPIETVHLAYEQTEVVGQELKEHAGGLAYQNLQARIRGAIVMIRSNLHGWLALTTGNKSELAVGYCTLYGDMAGGFAVLSDLYKRDVYALARHINQRAGKELIPVGILEKAPSAELAPNQFDQDSLPPYDLLDAILEELVENEQSAEEVSKKFPPETVRWVLQKLDRSEFKRYQAAPGIKLNRRAFGSGRRVPMAAKITAFPSE